LKQILKKLFAATDGSLFKSDNVNIVFIVLSQFELVSFIQQIEKFTTVYFVEGKTGFEMFEVRLNETLSTLAK